MERVQEEEAEQRCPPRPVEPWGAKEAEQRCAPRQVEPWGAKEAELRGKNRIKVS
jgi:hypothetical protein